MRKLKVRLLSHFSMIFILATAVGTFMLTIDNMYLFHSSLAELLEFNIPAVVAGDFIILILLLCVAAFFLRNYENKRDLQQSLIRLPERMFGALLLISFALSCLYHYADIVFNGGSLTELTVRDLWMLSKNFVSEISIALIIGTLQFALSRRVIRPYIVGLGPIEQSQAASSSFVRPLLIATLSFFFVTGYVSIEYLMINQTGNIDFNALLIIAGMRFGFGVVIFYILIVEMRGDLHTVLASIRGLLQGASSVMHKPIPVVSGDELGGLTEAFNILQRKMAQDYEEVQQELKLAFNVQQKLLPQTYRLHEGFEIAAVSIPSKEVGGDLFDIAELKDGGFAVMIGDVSGKGIPAAMLMSAALVLFRSELRKGGTPGEVLTRLNALFAGTLQGTMYITMGIGMWHHATSTWHYASAGHISPYLLSAGKRLETLSVCSLPLGIDAEETYEDLFCELRSGDRLLLYSDGVVETGTDEGEMFGFERFEKMIEGLPQSENVRDDLGRLMDCLPKSQDSRYDDDRTVMLIRCSESQETMSDVLARPLAEIAVGR